MTTQELQRELDRLESRRAELIEEIEAAHAALTSAQAKLIDGGGSSDEAMAAQSRLTALEGAAEALAERIGATREKLAEAEEVDRIDATREKLTELRKIGEGAGKMITEAHERLNTVFEETVTVLLEAGSRRDDARRAYQNLARTIGEDDDLPRLPAPPYDDVLIAQAVQTATGRREYKERTRRAAERRMATA